MSEQREVDPEEVVSWYTEDPGSPVVRGTWAEYQDFLDHITRRAADSWLAK